MLEIRCDGLPLYRQGSRELLLLEPRCCCGCNMVDSASFTIPKTHPNYSALSLLRSRVEIIRDGEVLFRGRPCGQQEGLEGLVSVELEGQLGCCNDSLIPPFSFPYDFPEADEADNVVEFFFRWLLEQHNAQVQPWQRLLPGVVTVRDKNNYLYRKSEDYASCWTLLREKLFESALGGYLYPRYEADGTYLDYVAELPISNAQPIALGKNLLEAQSSLDACETYTAILPTGASSQQDGKEQVLTIAGLPQDRDPAPGIGIRGLYLYSKEAVERFGWIVAPREQSSWPDVTQLPNLLERALETLSGQAAKLTQSLELRAADLSFTDREIEALRPCRSVLVTWPGQGLQNQRFPLTQLESQLLQPQNTVVTVGRKTRTLGEQIRQQQTQLQEELLNKNQQLAQHMDSSLEQQNQSLQSQLLEQITAIKTSTQALILEAGEKYVKTGDFESYKSQVSSALQVQANSISATFTSLSESISTVDGQTQQRFEQLNKYIRMGLDGITIGAEGEPLQLNVDNDMIKFLQDGVPKGRWDGDYFYTGNLVIGVSERAQLGIFAFVPRSDQSLMFLKVGDPKDQEPQAQTLALREPAPVGRCYHFDETGTLQEVTEP